MAEEKPKADLSLLTSVIYREEPRPNGMQGEILCEVEGDLPPPVGMTVWITTDRADKHPFEKLRYQVTSVEKEVYARARYGATGLGPQVVYLVCVVEIPDPYKREIALELDDQ